MTNTIDSLDTIRIIDEPAPNRSKVVRLDPHGSRIPDFLMHVTALLVAATIMTTRSRVVKTVLTNETGDIIATTETTS